MGLYDDLRASMKLRLDAKTSRFPQKTPHGNAIPCSHSEGARMARSKEHVRLYVVEKKAGTGGLENHARIELHGYREDAPSMRIRALWDLGPAFDAADAKGCLDLIPLGDWVEIRGRATDWGFAIEFVDGVPL